MTSPATDIFISYKAEERKRLVPLVKALEAEGFSVWWDQNISGGTNWREEIESHLDAAKVVIVVWSKRSVGPEGRFVRDEAGVAQEAGHYLPITVDNVRPPIGFREVQALDLSSWWGKKSDPRFQLLCGTIRHRLEGGAIAPKALAIEGPGVSRRTAIAGGIGAGAIAVAGTGAWLLLKPSAANAKRIAVLPFANLSGSADQAYFADGIAEELRGALARIGLEVIGRASSVAVKDLDTKEAAAKLGVANILTGSVRRSSQMVRISAQLVGGTDGVERWAQNYDRAAGDEIKIQTDIATNVADALSVALGQVAKSALTLGGTSDSIAQDLYWRALAGLRASSSGKELISWSLDPLNAAIARDPRFAEAFRLKSRALETLGGNYGSSPADIADRLGEGEIAAKTAIRLAPKLGSAYLALAVIQADQFRFSDAVENMRRGMELSVDDTNSLRTAGLCAQRFGNPRRAVEIARRVVQLDPLAEGSYLSLGVALWTAEDYAGSIKACRSALAHNPKFLAAHQYIGLSHLMVNRFAEARVEFEKMSPDDPYRVISLAYLAARSGQTSAEEAIVPLRKIFGEAASYQYGEIYAQAGLPDRAFAALDDAIRVKDPGILQLRSDPLLAPIIHDPRYTALVKRLDFPAWT